MVFDEYVDQFKEAIDVLFSDKARFGAIFVIAAIVLGILAAVNIAPSFTGFVHNPDLNYCSYPINKQSFILVPVFTYFTNPPLGQSEMACPFLTQNYPLIIIYYIEISAILIIAVLIGIMVLNLSG